MSKHRAIPLPAIILVTLLVQLATPGIAWADGESPPTEEQPAVEVSSESEPAPDPAATPEAAEEPVPVVPEILEAAPAGTEVVVVDSSGAAEPLATQEAAESLASSDPEWCPEGSSPGDAGCTGSYGTVDELLDAIGAGGYSGNGTIYFTTNYSTDDAYIRGSDARLAALQALGIDGRGNTVSVPIEVTGWAYAVSVANVTVDLSTYAGSTAGLRIETTGAIEVTDVSVTGTGADGAVLDNTAGTESITVTDSTFTDNTWTGLDARSEGDITLTNVTATGQEDGAYLDASEGEGSVTVNGGDFSNNTVAGLTARAGEGGITINGVTANANSGEDAYGIGLKAKRGGSVTVTNSEASGNGSKGLWIEGTGPVTLQNVTADANGLHGVYVHNLNACTASPISLTVDGGTFTNNGGYGLAAVLGPNGNLTFTNPATFGGNGLGDYVLNLDPCPECEEKEEGKPYNIVYVPETEGPPVPLDCENYIGTVLILPNGDRVTLVCPVSGEATLSSVPSTGLPGPLPIARTFVSGASIGLSVSVLTEGGYLVVSFVIPEGLQGSSLAILYWDPLTSSWVELPAFSTRPDGSPMLHRLHPDVSPDDMMYILGGVRVGADTVTVKVSFGGTFVLASR